LRRTANFKFGGIKIGSTKNPVVEAGTVYISATLRPQYNRNPGLRVSKSAIVAFIKPDLGPVLLGDNF
jgi:hypothetical protein